MKFRVKPGAKFQGAGAGEIVDVEPHRAALVPWCLEPVADEPPPRPAPTSIPSDGVPRQDSPRKKSRL